MGHWPQTTIRRLRTCPTPPYTAYRTFPEAKTNTCIQESQPFPTPTKQTRFLQAFPLPMSLSHPPRCCPWRQGSFGNSAPTAPHTSNTPSTPMGTGSQECGHPQISAPRHQYLSPPPFPVPAWSHHGNPGTRKPSPTPSSGRIPSPLTGFLSKSLVPAPGYLVSLSWSSHFIHSFIQDSSDNSLRTHTGHAPYGVLEIWGGGPGGLPLLHGHPLSSQHSSFFGSRCTKRPQAALLPRTQLPSHHQQLKDSRAAGGPGPQNPQQTLGQRPAGLATGCAQGAGSWSCYQS